MNENKHFLAGREKYKAGNYAIAYIAYSEAINIEPNNAEIYYQRAMCSFHQKQLNTSLMDLDHAAKLEPLNPFRYASRAYVKGIANDLEGAVKDYEKAIELDPEDAISHNNLGLVHEKMGYKKQAEKHFKKADEYIKTQDFSSPEEDKKASLLTQELINDINQESASTENKQGYLTIIKNVFTDASTRKDFIAFIKAGFKDKNNEVTNQ